MEEKQNIPKLVAFQLFDTVTSKQTGLPMQGQVHGVLTGLGYSNVINQGRPCKRWDDLYPDWKNKPVIFVIFKVPQKPVSIEEIQANIHCEREQAKQLFDDMKPSLAAYYPVDDLEIVETAQEELTRLKLEEEQKNKEEK